MHMIRTRTRVVLLLIVLANLMPDRAASAQSIGRFEVGGQVAALRIQDFGSTPGGFGGRFSYELLDWLSLESEFNLFPRETVMRDLLPLTGGDSRMVYRRQRSEAVFGAKLGMRTGRFGLFAKVRPGFARLSDQTTNCVDVASGLACPAVDFDSRPQADRTDFALDLGGVFEFYPLTRMVARVDVGDTILRYGGVPRPCPTCTSHNVSSRFGIGLRF